MVSSHLNDAGVELRANIQRVVFHHVESHSAHHQHMLLVVQIHTAEKETHTKSIGLELVFNEGSQISVRHHTLQLMRS